MALHVTKKYVDKEEDKEKEQEKSTCAIVCRRTGQCATSDTKCAAENDYGGPEQHPRRKKKKYRRVTIIQYRKCSGRKAMHKNVVENDAAQNGEFGALNGLVIVSPLSRPFWLLSNH